MGSEVPPRQRQRQDVVIIVPTVDLSGTHKETFGYGSKISFSFQRQRVATS